MGIFPEWHKSLFQRLMGSKKMSGLMHVRQFAGQRLEAKCEKVFGPGESSVDPTAPVDLITKLLRIQDENPEKMAKGDIASACMMNIGAGSDTTSISLSSVIFHLLKNPETLERLRDEIRDCEKRGDISDPAKFSETQRMPYLQAVIKEALRKHSATGLTLGRTVPPQGATLAGYFFPGSVRDDTGIQPSFPQPLTRARQTVVGINPWVAHSNQDVFGVDAEEFRPERWLAAPEVVKRRESYFMAASRTPPKPSVPAR
jgi:cytochrome P450